MIFNVKENEDYEENTNSWKYQITYENKYMYALICDNNIIEYYITSDCDYDTFIDMQSLKELENFCNSFIDTN